MLVAGLVTIAIILGFVAHQYLKGTSLRSFAGVIAAVFGAAVAFSYFEPAAALLIKRGYGGEWAQPGVFVILFILSFAVLQAIAGKLIRNDVDFGLAVTRSVNIICGTLLGLILAGVLLTAAAMTPIPAKWPYPRFGTDTGQIDPDNPSKVLLRADGFVTGLFRILSKGSLSGDKSFAVFHPRFLDQIHLNRQTGDEDISTIAGAEAVVVSKKAEGAWLAPENLVSASTGEPLTAKPRHNLIVVRVGLVSASTDEPLTAKLRHNLIVVRVGIKPGTAKEGGATDEKGDAQFTLAQLRLICKEKSDKENTFAGASSAVYPVGYMASANQVQVKRLSDDIVLERSDFSGKTKYIDFVFKVPAGSVPVLIEFKTNALAQVPPVVPAEQGPEAIGFVQTAKCTADLAEVSPVSRAKIRGVELAAGAMLLDGLSLPVENLEQWQKIERPVFGMGRTQVGGEGQTITYARTRFVVPGKEKPRRERRSRRDGRRTGKPQGFAAMLELLEGYKLLSLKCNELADGRAIRGAQLPVLIDATGGKHHAVGVVAAGKTAEQIVYQLDYCSLRAEQINGGLVIGADGCVAKPFGDLWLAEQVSRITELYVLYLVKGSRPPLIITFVQPAGARVAAGFKEYEGFLVRLDRKETR